jgi:hypothetical protein
MNSNIFADPSVNLFMRVRRNDDELAIVLKGHLLVEYLLNKIIAEKCKSPKNILEDSRNYTFSVKLQILYAMGLLPEIIYGEIVRLNKFRNKYAHNLEFELKPDEMILIDFSGKNRIFKTKGKKFPEREYLKTLCFSILLHLRNHMLKELNLDPRFK